MSSMGGTGGAYRPAHRVREGWQVFDLSGEWMTVAKVLRVYSPLSFVRLDFSDGSHAILRPADEVNCQTLAEVKAAVA